MGTEGKGRTSTHGPHGGHMGPHGPHESPCAQMGSPWVPMGSPWGSEQGPMGPHGAMEVPMGPHMVPMVPIAPMVPVVPVVPVVPLWLPLVPCVALERPPIILVRRPIYGPISCARLLPPVAPQICCAKIALVPSARFEECPAEKFFGGAMRGLIR